MRLTLRSALVLAVITLTGPRALRAQATVSAGPLSVTIDAHGSIAALRSRVTGIDYLAADTSAPLLTIVHEGHRVAPATMRRAAARSGALLTLEYPSLGARIDVRVRQTPTHLVFEIMRAEPARAIEAVVWGPYPTTIRQTIGEIIGVVRDDRVALGLQVLNLATLGGDFPNDEGSTWARGIAAQSRAWGSVLQAYAINRARARTVSGWGGNFPRMPVAPLPGATVVGSAIALFSCADSATRDVLERIEIEEHLPHPTIAGVWFPRSALFERSYLIASFGESDVDEMIAYTRRAGLMSLYHEGPFTSWGHFVLDSAQFPHGRAGMKTAVDKARAAGLHLGVHTLTNFINTNDPYVTPVPDDRLSVTGSSVLAQAVDATKSRIEVQSPEYFAEQKNNVLHTVKIGRELIQYRAVSATAPFVLLECQRGAFGTTASAHQAGEVVGKLLDHSYKVFFPNFAMQREVAGNLAAFLNETGVDHLDFDGHEGALASGQGDYALGVFADDVMRQTTHDLIMGTSISKTFYWHIGSYYNWGEPWYGGFKESMQQYRIDNQGLFDRNFMPHMLGWYLLTEHTTLAEMEWMLARAAGYRAGFAMVARPKALRTNPLTPVLLDAIREWERARTSHAFDSAQQARLKDPRNEFHLTALGDSAWDLQQYATSPVFTRERFERQPGEPTHTTWTVTQPWNEQPLQFRLSVVGKTGAVRNLTLVIDQVAAVDLPITLTAGESLASDGSTTVQVYDALGKPKSTLALTRVPPLVGPGIHTVTMESAFDGDEPPKIEVQFKGLQRTERVRPPGVARSARDAERTARRFIEGHITDSLTGQGIARATVSVTGTTLRARTDGQGAFRMDITSRQRLSVVPLEIRAAGYRSRTLAMRDVGDSLDTDVVALLPSQSVRKRQPPLH
jgi:hypothetical protein